MTADLSHQHTQRLTVFVFTVLRALLAQAQPDWKGTPADEPANEYEGSPELDADAATAERSSSWASTRGAAGLALLAAVTLDGVPKNVALSVAFCSGPAD